jgi:prophage regulatory protein
MIDPLIRAPEVLAALGDISRSTLYKMVRQGVFPAPRRLGPRCSVWKASEVQAFIDRRAVGATAAAVPAQGASHTGQAGAAPA